MRQGEAYRDIEITITEDGVVIPISTIESVDFNFSGLVKNYPKDAEYLNGSFFIPLTAEDTKGFGTHVVVQHTITFVDGEIRVSNKKLMLVNKLLERS